MSVTIENKQIARHALDAFGGTLQVRIYHHDTMPLSVDILSCSDRPYDGVTSYSTIGLSDHPMYLGQKEFPAGACASNDELFANILASAAFCIMRSKKFFGPGSALEGYVQEYYPNTSMPNLFLTAPFLWEDSLKTLDCGTKKSGLVAGRSHFGL